MRQELQPVLALAQTLPSADLPSLLGALEEIRVTALARIVVPTVEGRPDESLTIDQAHKRLGVSKGYLYRHWQEFKFARQEGRKVLFSSNGLDLYLRKSR
jgi:hypothetical protein